MVLTIALASASALASPQSLLPEMHPDSRIADRIKVR